MSDRPVYTTQTPYYIIEKDLINSYGKYYERNLHELSTMHKKWKRLTKLAQQGMIGVKY